MRSQPRIGQRFLDQPVTLGPAVALIQGQFEQIRVQAPFQFAGNLRFPEQIAALQTGRRPACAGDAQSRRAGVPRHRRHPRHNIIGRAHQIEAEGAAMQFQGTVQPEIPVDKSGYPFAPPGDVAPDRIVENFGDGLPVERRKCDVGTGDGLGGHSPSCGDGAGRIKERRIGITGPAPPASFTLLRRKRLRGST